MQGPYRFGSLSPKSGYHPLSMRNTGYDEKPRGASDSLAGSSSIPVQPRDTIRGHWLQKGGRKMPRKRRIDQHRADADLRQQRVRPQLSLILDNIRSLNNVGAIFRAADGFGVQKIFLCGITPTPPRPEIKKISLGAELTTDWEHVEDPAMAVRVLQNEGVTVLALEQTKESSSLYEVEMPHPLAIVLGHEVVGIDEQVLFLCDGSIEIPMFGAKHSHNVAISCGIVLSEVRRNWLSLGTPPPWESTRSTSDAEKRT